MIQVHNVWKQFGEDPVLRGLDVHLPAAQVALLTGPNGAGKSTLLRILAGLMPPDRGCASIAGRDVVRERQAAQAQLAYLPQAVRFHDRMTPRQVLRFYAQLRGVEAAPPDDLLAEVGLLPAADRPCSALSGGMRQRLGLALTWQADTPVILLDEPGLSLDVQWRAYLFNRLQALAAAGRTILMATHLVEVWQSLADVQVEVAEDGAARRLPDRARAHSSFSSIRISDLS